MIAAVKTKNWVSGASPEVLDDVHQKEKNIAIYNRDIIHLKDELDLLITKEIELRSSGTIEEIFGEVSKAKELSNSPLIKKDITGLIHLFSHITSSNDYRLYLATVTNNMCRKFHTDINDLRMLCTYRGPGTLWLTEDNINREEEDCCDDPSCMIIDESRIQQAEQGSVIILKGAIYPKDGTNPILHRSPTIEESGEKRLLLRLDTDGFANFN